MGVQRMKKHLLEVVLLGAALAILISVCIISTNKEKDEENKVMQEQLALKEQESVNTVLEDDSGDLTYNYLSGMEKMSQYDRIPYNYYMDVADSINDYLQSNDIKGKELKLVSTSRKGLIFTTKFEIQGLDKKLVNTFDLLEWEFENKLE